MKNAVLILIVGFLFSISNPVEAQMSNREMRKTLKSRTPHEVKKQAKVYEKDGYKVAVGALSVERQLVNAWIKEGEIDDKGFPRYIIATGNSVGETQIVAKLQAIEAAKLELAGTIATNVAALVENNFANSQLSTEEAASVTQTIAASKSVIAQEIGRTLTLVEMYRNIGENMEANVRLAYSNELAMETAKNVIRKNLKKETDILQDKLEKLMNF
jgi:hypothetical protein